VRSPRFRFLASILALAAVYTLVAKVGLMMGPVAGFATLVWPPSGIALAALLVLGLRAWPGVALGAFAINLWIGGPIPVAAGIAVGNTLEAFVGAYALLKLAGFDRELDRLRDVLSLVVLAGLFSTLLSASLGVGSLVLGGLVTPAHAPDAWRVWWLGDLDGDLLVAPALLTLGHARRALAGIGEVPERTTEALALALTTAAATFAIFGPFSLGIHSMVYLFPLLTWAALRFGQRGVSLMTLLVSGAAIWGTAAGHGPFVGETLTASLFPLQSFMAVVSTTALVLGATISERNAAVRESARLYQQAQAAVRSRDEILAVVSHDLNNNLSGILASTQLMMKAEEREDQRVAARSLQLVHRSAKRMARLIGDLLDSASLNSGSLSLEVAPQDANTLIREALELEGPSAQQKGLRLEAASLEGPVEVVCDRSRIVQVLVNLIGNAVKFTEAGSIQTAIRLSDRELVFEVRDTGSGIRPEQLEHIFDRYWTGRPSHGSGHGLGLHIAKGIVEAHGGRIWAESAADQGSTFFFSLPLAA